MPEIVKQIKDTNASYRSLEAGNAHNTDLFLDHQNYTFFEDCVDDIGVNENGVNERGITVRFNKENLQQAILFIASILPRKYDCSSIHENISFSTDFVYNQLSILDSFFMQNGVSVKTRKQVWKVRIDVPKANGQIDNRFYFKGLLDDVNYVDCQGESKNAKFTIRNYLAGGYSVLHFIKEEVLNDKVIDVRITNNIEYQKDEEYCQCKDKTIFYNDQSLQKIFYGAPGTGKSNTIKSEVDHKDLPRVRTTFHPDSDYSTFVGAYKPTSVEVPEMTKIGTKAVPVENPDGTPRKEKKIVYEFVPQAFLKAYTGAWKNQDEPFFLIIEEINRGNCAQIFGDLFQLLDRNDETGLSDYPISPDEDIQKFLLTDKKYGFAALTDAQKAAIPTEVQSGELMILPKNFHIWATMNTSDQSLFPIDSAFKRRWDWQYMPISDAQKGWQIEANGKRYDWWQFLQKMNDKIGSTTNSEDKKLGYFFCKAKNGIIDSETFVGKVVFYIWNDVFKDFAEEAGDLFKDSSDPQNPLLSFNKFYTIGMDGKAKVVDEKVERLFQNLGVNPLAESEIDEEDEEDSETTEGKDYTRYTINGEGSIPKRQLSTQAVRKYIELNPELTPEQVVANWMSLGNIVSHFVETKEQFDARTDNSKRSFEVPCGDSIIYVACNGWGIGNKMQTLIDSVNNKDWGIKLAIKET